MRRQTRGSPGGEGAGGEPGRPDVPAAGEHESLARRHSRHFYEMIPELRGMPYEVQQRFYDEAIEVIEREDRGWRARLGCLVWAICAFVTLSGSAALVMSITGPRLALFAFIGVPIQPASSILLSSQITHKSG